MPGSDHHRGAGPCVAFPSEYDEMKMKSCDGRRMGKEKEAEEKLKISCRGESVLIDSIAMRNITRAERSGSVGK